MSSATLDRIDKKLENMDPESMRYKVLMALRHFRASWLELGRMLNDVAFGGDHKEWGYEEFEVYCARELGLKKPTVQKLMVSYNYMKSYEPKRLKDFEKGEGVPNIPDYQTVDLLHRARQQEGVDEKRLGQLHERVFGGEEEEGALRKDIREAIRPMSDSEMGERNADRKRELNDILRTARVLRRKLAHAQSIPGGLKDRFEQLLLELESMD